jgi:hypothetical protein
MIIVKLSGGLGNQMFQYASGRSLASRLQVKLKLDVTGYDDGTLRRYELHNLNIREQFATDTEIATLKTGGRTFFKHIVDKICNRQLPDPPFFFREENFHFDPRLLQLPDGAYLDGYWQSEKYFAEIAETIREEFTVSKPLTGRNKELSEQILASNAVSVHVRRGDYVEKPDTAAYHGACDRNYYLRCFDAVCRKVSNPAFFAFSDEPDWVKREFSLPVPITVVDVNSAEQGYEDMRLMSHCKSHIIANSSFSWWGGWLANAPGKNVFAPRRWFADDSIDTSDLIPEDWVRI